MEIALIAIVALVIVAFVVGGMDNNRPVSEWSDDKLARMHGKLVHLAGIKMKAGDYKTDKNDLLLEEVKKEIIARQVKHEMGAAFAEKVNERSKNNAAAWDLAVNNHSKKNNTTKEKSHETLSAIMPKLISKYQSMGHDQLAATDLALDEIKNI